jgi:hypothetical protein
MLVDSLALPLAHRHDKDQKLVVTHLVDEMLPGGPQLALGAVGGST